MTRKFAIGEVCIVANTVAKCAQHLIGTECTVLSHDFFGRSDVCQYTVFCVDGTEWGANECHLRKKKPPEDMSKWIVQDTVPWEKTPFVPFEKRKQNAHALVEKLKATPIIDPEKFVVGILNDRIAREYDPWKDARIAADELAKGMEALGRAYQKYCKHCENTGWLNDGGVCPFCFEPEGK